MNISPFIIETKVFAVLFLLTCIIVFVLRFRENLWIARHILPEVRAGLLPRQEYVVLLANSTHATVRMRSRQLATTLVEMLVFVMILYFEFSILFLVLFAIVTLGQLFLLRISVVHTEVVEKAVRTLTHTELTQWKSLVRMKSNKR